MVFVFKIMTSATNFKFFHLQKQKSKLICLGNRKDGGFSADYTIVVDTNLCRA